MLKNCVFLSENCYFSEFYVLHFFAVSWSIFELYRPILPFWNPQYVSSSTYIKIIPNWLWIILDDLILLLNTYSTYQISFLVKLILNKLKYNVMYALILHNTRLNLISERFRWFESSRTCLKQNEFSWIYSECNYTRKRRTNLRKFRLPQSWRYRWILKYLRSKYH